MTIGVLSSETSAAVVMVIASNSIVIVLKGLIKILPTSFLILIYPWSICQYFHTSLYQHEIIAT